MGNLTVRDEALGAAFDLDERFVDAGFGRDEELPSSHLIASEPHEGRIAALALVTVQAEPLAPEEWLAQHVARTRASFAEWSPDAHEMLVAPGPASLAGRPAVHVRYRLLSRGAERAPAPDAEGAPLPDADGAPDAGRAPDEGAVPASLVEHWTVHVEERRRLLVVEMMVQPPAWWDEERDQLELPFRTLELI
jgi:hypothetical protein